MSVDDQKNLIAHIASATEKGTKKLKPIKHSDFREWLIYQLIDQIDKKNLIIVEKLRQGLSAHL